MNSLLTHSLILTSAFLATSAGANADPVQVGLSASPAVSAASPVRINHMTPTGTKLIENNMMPGHIEISFTNETATPATDVVFGLLDNENQTIHQYDQSGTFAQGTEIVKQLPYDSVLDRQIVSAEVDEVTFADGSVWEKPAALAPLSRRQATSLNAGSVREATPAAATQATASQKAQILEPYPGFDGNPNK